MKSLILVTGGSRGIGRGICLELSKMGYSIAINYAGNKHAAETTLELCRQTAQNPDQEFQIFQADIADSQQRTALIDSIYEQMGCISSLINNAGIAPPERVDLLEMKETSFDQVLNVNLKGPFFLTQLLANRWVKEADTKGKSIIFLSSVSASSVSLTRGEYCMSKAGIAMAVSLFAARLAEFDIPVFEVRPGIIKTDMTSQVEELYSSNIAGGLVPQKRWGTPEDLGKAVASLLGGGFPFSTGTIISVDGGLHISRL